MKHVSLGTVRSQLETVQTQIEAASFRDTFSRVRFEAMERLLQKEACLVMAIDMLVSQDETGAIQWIKLSQEV